MVDLLRMRQLLKQTINIQWKLEQEQAAATKITSVLTGMPRSSGTHSQVEDGAIKIAALKEEYGSAIEELERMREELNELVNTLDDVNHRATIRMRYIRGYKMDSIADAIGVKRRTIYRYLTRAEDELCEKYPDKIVRKQEKDTL